MGELAFAPLSPHWLRRSTRDAFIVLGRRERKVHLFLCALLKGMGPVGVGG